MNLPERTLDTMSLAIAMSSPSGRMSNRSRKAHQERLRVALFGEKGLQFEKPPQPSKKEYLLNRAKMLRDFANRGFKPRAHLKEAIKCEQEAETL